MAPTKFHVGSLDDSLPDIPLREKAELRLLVEKDVRFAKTLEKTNIEVRKLHVDGEKGNQTFLALLARMMWCTLQILWDLEEGESSIPKLRKKQKIEVILDELKVSQEQMHVCRRAYLKELSALRDRLRDQDSCMMERIDEVVYHEDPVMYYEPLQFVEDDRIKMFVAEVVEEKLKLIMTRWSQKVGKKVDRPATAPDKSRGLASMSGPSPIEATLREENARLKDIIAQLENRLKTLEDENAKVTEGSKSMQHSDAEDVAELRREIERLEKEKLEQAATIKSLDFHLKDIQQSINHFQAAIKSKDGEPEEEIKETDVTSLIERSQRRRGIVKTAQLEELANAATLAISTLESEETELQVQIAAEEIKLEKAKDGTEQKERAMTNITAAKASLSQVVARISAKRAELVEIRKRTQLAPEAVAARVRPTILTALSRFKGLKTQLSLLEEDGEEGAVIEPAKVEEDPKEEVVTDKLDFSFGIVRLMLTQSRTERADLQAKNAALAEELRIAKEKLLASSKLDAQDTDMRAKLELATQENQRLKHRTLESDNTELEELHELMKKKNARIKELEDELKRYQLMSEELLIQLSEHDKLGAAQTKGVRRVDFGLNFRQPQGERNVFERLYRDAIERLSRMEYLRQRFIQEIFKMEPMLYRLSDDVPDEYSNIVHQSELAKDLEFFGVPKLKRCVSKRMDRAAMSDDGLAASMSVIGERAKGELDHLYPFPNFSGSRGQRPASATGFAERKMRVLRRNPMSRPQSAALLASKRSLPLLLGYP
eukprot:GEMP01018287.1.p1 GENE.GEMP01018287.1~~GEMP01018287.1.p1  ORF type:complete len:774 (+),score=205.05 GEMP01018287.1:123-2444(+)